MTARSDAVQLLAFGLVSALVLFMVAYPVGMMITESFRAQGGAWTLQYWRETLHMPVLGEIVWNTLVVTVAATAIALVVGTPLARIVARTNMPFAGLFEYISIVPFLTPPIIAGFAWQLLGERQSGILNRLLEAIGLPLRIDVMSLTGVTLVSALYLVPFVFLVATGTLRTMNAELEEASLIVGATRWTTFRRITLPLLRPALASASVLAFAYSITLFGIHATLGMPVNIWFLTTVVYQAVNVVPAQVNQASVLACLLMALGVVATYLQIRLTIASYRYQTLSGKGARVRPVSMGALRWIFVAVCATYVFVATIVPYAILLLRSLKPYMFQAGMQWKDLVTGWDFTPYSAIAMGQDPILLRALLNSFALAVAASCICLVIGSVAAYIIERTKTSARHILSYLGLIPLTLPSVVLGIAILAAYSREPFRLYGTIWILLVAYVTKDLPIGLKAIQASLAQLHGELDEAARICGASWVRQFTTITLPLLKPGLAIAFVLTFASTLREIGASILLYSEGNEVVAYVLFNQWENGDFQKLSAFIVVTTIVTLAVVAVILKLGRLGFSELTQADGANR